MLGGIEQEKERLFKPVRPKHRTAPCENLVHLQARQAYNLDMLSLVRSHVPDPDETLIPSNVSATPFGLPYPNQCAPGGTAEQCASFSRH
jgi:hypothetical protein